MVLTILGYYGKNFGDLLMLQGIINNLYQEANKINIISYDFLNLENIITPIGKMVNVYQISQIRLKERVNIFRSSDILMWGGGSCFNDVDGTGAIKQMIFAKFVNPEISINYYGVGIDLNRSTKNRFYLNLALLLSDSFSVRDEDSFSKVKSFKCTHIVEDPIYFNRDFFNSIKINKTNKRLIVAYRNVDKYYPKKSKSYLNDFIASLRIFISKNEFEEILIVSCDYDVDMSDNLLIYKSIKDLSNVDFVNSYNVDFLCHLIAGSSAVITGRLHIAVVANIFNVPFALLNYSRKNESFCIKTNNIQSILEYEDLNKVKVFECLNV